MILAPGLNQLTAAEVKAGWQLLFDGKSTSGWHNFRQKSVTGSGWVVKNGELTITDPHNAGDIVTDKSYDWFELELDFKLGKGQNSGIVFHIDEAFGEAMWQTGPEIQIYDEQGDESAEATGFLYQLYRPAKKAKINVEGWNHFRIVVSPRNAYTMVNGVKYYEWDPGSKDFWLRVDKSKFSDYPWFGRYNAGKIGIQGDHGLVSFKNVKIRPMKLSN